MIISEIVFFFLLGITLGSFFNVCIYRLPRGESISWPSSRCTRCKTPVKIYHNIPLISYLSLRGRCHACKERFSLRYPLVEGISGLFFVAVYLKFGLSTQIAAWLLLTALLIIITFIDIEFKLILNKVTIPGLVLGALFSWLSIPLAPLEIGLGSAVGIGLLAGVAVLGKALFGKESMGMGDVKMAGMIGVFLGVKGIAIALFLGFIIAGIFGFVGMAVKKLERGSYMPFGPFIAAGTFVYLFFGDQILRWYLRTVGLG